MLSRTPRSAMPATLAPAAPLRPAPARMPQLGLRLLVAATLALGGCGSYEEAAYPEAPRAPLPEPRVAAAEPAEEPGATEPAQVPEPFPPPPGEDAIVGGDNDPAAYRETDPSALTEFRSTLDPYGAWVDDDTYGTVWVPAAHVVGPDFTPYVTAGHWSYDDGYVWASDYDWGWAPFHYGRWVYIGGRGWAWIPGRVYRGAWVVWRAGPVGFGYVGWGPAPPLWYWRGGYAYGFSGAYRTPYYFCETRHVFQPQVTRHVVRGPLAGDIGRRTEAYVPAQPRVAQPGDRVAANPTVGGVGHAGAPVALRRGAEGPSLNHLGLDPARVPRPSPTDRGSARAFELGAPHTAVALGARPPSVAPRPVGAWNPAVANQPSRPGPARLGSPAPAHDPRVAPAQLGAAPHASAPTRLPPLRSEPQPRPHATAPRMTDSPRSPPLVEHHRAPSSAPSWSHQPSAPTRAPSVSAAPAARPSVRSSPPSVSRPSAPSVPSPRPPSTSPRSAGKIRR